MSVVSGFFMQVSYGPYRYVKAIDGVASPKPLQNRLVLVAAIGCLLIGGGILTATFLPIAAWQLTSSGDQQLLFPTQPFSNSGQNASSLILGASTTSSNASNIHVQKLADGFSYFTDDAPPQTASYDRFYISIPALNLSNLTAIVNSTNFDHNLGHLPGTALPGNVGNVFISGHSALPAFYSPTNFKTIFTHLPDLTIFDEIDVNAGGKLYRYSVERKFIVDPSDVSVVTPPDPFGKYITLMTCVPPGLNIERLIVQARLIE